MAVSLSPFDPNSYSRPEDWKTIHIDIDWNVNFEKHILEGHVDLEVEKQSETEEEILFLDTRDLKIKNISNVSNGIKLRYVLHDPIASFGSKLEIGLPAGERKIIVRIEYETSPNSSALQWLSPEQTAGKKHPYVFSQCQAIHARSMLPCQDSPGIKATYTATVTAPSSLTVLMGAIRQGGDADKKFNFHQSVPIPSYLIAIAVGALEFRKIGSRCGVWSEKELIDMAAEEFTETESFLKIGESLMGSYVWGRYDILVLPPSFPFGGMENPCLTFLTPTLLAGDKSLSNVVAHEIAHSWTGNLVTNRNFEHFWLNEGFTVFIERKIVGRLMGEKYRHFQALIGWKELTDAISNLGADNQLTNLVIDLKGIDPDDAFSTVPYEKGHAFLFYLETLVGGSDLFEQFLKAYIEKYNKMSIDTEQWKDFFLDYFSDKVTSSILSEIDWNSWLHTPGLPPVIPKFDDSLAVECKALCKRWIETIDLTQLPKTDSNDMTSLQMCYFLSQLLEKEPLQSSIFEALTSTYSFENTRNSEIKFRWIRLGIRSRWPEILPHALKFVSDQGRLKYVRPVFRDLYACEEMRQSAIDKYKEIKCGMMHVTANMVAKDLNLRSENK